MFSSDKIFTQNIFDPAQWNPQMQNPWMQNPWMQRFNCTHFGTGHNFCQFQLILSNWSKLFLRYTFWYDVGLLFPSPFDSNVDARKVLWLLLMVSPSSCSRVAFFLDFCSKCSSCVLVWSFPRRETGGIQNCTAASLWSPVFWQDYFKLVL